MSKLVNFAQVLVTYPQCDRSKEDCLEFLKGLGIQCAVVCQEDHHETEGKHLHAWVKFPKMVRSRQFTSYFDWEGVHGNYQKVTISARSKESCLSTIYSVLRPAMMYFTPLAMRFRP